MVKTYKQKDTGLTVIELMDKREGSKVLIIPELGGTVVSFFVAGREVLYYDKDNVESKERPRCGIPILFPACGRSKENQVNFEGELYPMPVHGFAHTSSWLVEDMGEKSVMLELIANELTYEYFPYAFRLQILYTLLANQLHIQILCKNTGEISMPYGIGLHPYFAIDSIDRVRFDVDAEDMLDYHTNCTSKVKIPFYLPKGQEVTRFYPGSSRVEMYDEVYQRRVLLSFSSYFKDIVIWRPEDARFVCIEPWGSRPNSLNGTDATKLASQEEVRCQVSIMVWN